jgi:hypothetical protein
MDCRHFRHQHLAYLDDTLPGDVMREARQHLLACASCAAHDTRIRRSLMLAHNHLPQLEPSPDFRARLDARLAGCAAECRGAAPDAVVVIEAEAFAVSGDFGQEGRWRSRTAWLAMAASVAVVSVVSLARSRAVIAEPELSPVLASAPHLPALQPLTPRLSTPRAPTPLLLPALDATGALRSPPGSAGMPSAFLLVGASERALFVR